MDALLVALALFVCVIAAPIILYAWIGQIARNTEQTAKNTEAILRYTKYIAQEAAHMTRQAEPPPVSPLTQRATPDPQLR